jgi:hypothetical protein
VDGLESFQDFRRCFGRHGLGVDAVTVVVVEDKNLGIAATGGDRESSGLIGEDLSFNLSWQDCGKTMVGNGAL